MTYDSHLTLNHLSSRLLCRFGKRGGKDSSPVFENLTDDPFKWLCLFVQNFYQLYFEFFLDNLDKEKNIKYEREENTLKRQNVYFKIQKIWKIS